MTKISCELIEHGNDDLTVVNAARCSFAKHKEVFDEADRGLLGYLWKHEHWSPFAHPHLLFTQVELPNKDSLIKLLSRHSAGLHLEWEPGAKTASVAMSLYWALRHWPELSRDMRWAVGGRFPESCRVSGRQMQYPGLLEAGDRAFGRATDVTDCPADELLATHQGPYDRFWIKAANLTTMTVRVKVPIFLARQLHKHQVGLVCVSGDTEITFVKHANGKNAGLRRKKIKDLHDLWSGKIKYHGGEKGKHTVGLGWARVLNTETGRFERAKIIDVMHKGCKQVFEITTSSGKTVKMTREHRVWTRDGWQELQSAIGLDVTPNGVASMSREAEVGLNGRQYGGYDTYRRHDWMKARRDEGLDLAGIAAAADCATHTIRKWLKEHDLSFDQKANLTGVNGTLPWNKGRKGYRLPHKSEAERRQLSRLRSGPGSNFWRGGVTSERQKIAAWTSRNAAACHREHGYTCQQCGERKQDLHAHHIVPVLARPDLGMVFENLASVCQGCHAEIHRSPENEQALANLMRERGKIVKEYVPKNRRFVGNHLKVHYEKIIKVRLVGEEDVYDLMIDHPSHNFVGNGFVLHNCNEVSRRYVDEEPEFLEVDKWRSRPVNAKQGSGPALNGFRAELAVATYGALLEEAADSYYSLLSDEVAPEQARMVLPQSMMTEWYWTGSARAFARIVKQRSDPHAQQEAQEFAGLLRAEMVKALDEDYVDLILEGLDREHEFDLSIAA